MTDETDPTLPPAADPAPEPEVHAAPEPEVMPEPEPVTAATRLRAFEDEHFGKDAVRINGRIERGYGSKFKTMPAEQQAEYAALEKLVEAEQKLDEANTALFNAKVARDAAEADVEAAAKAAEEKAAEAA